MKKVKSKKDIPDNISAIFGEDDNISDYTPESPDKQELDFALPSKEKEELEKGKEQKDEKDIDIEIEIVSDDEKPEKSKNLLNHNPNAPPPESLESEQYKISLTLGEYLCSFFYKSESLKQKMQIINEGTKKLESRLDVVAILKKMRELDKLKAMLFDVDQAMLFNSLPKPELRPKSVAKHGDITPSSSPYGLLRKFTLRDQDQQDNNIHEMKNKLESKAKKTKIDERFIAVFKEKV